MKGPKNSKEKPAEDDETVKNILENVAPGGTIVIGVSGGPDSVYLLYRCLELRKRFHYDIAVAHINHGLRGKESDADERFVKKISKKNGIPFYGITVNLQTRPGKKKSPPNLEEAGREVRYAYFEKLRKKLEAEWILTAHHLNDNIETMLLNLIRGAHFGGIKGMDAVSSSRHLLRPLLGVTKNEILSYLKKHRIPFRADSSNNDTRFSRNWLRKNIIPLFPKLNANFEQTFKETLRNFTETARYLEEQCEKWLKKYDSRKIRIELDAFLKEHISFQKQLLVHLYKKLHGSTKKLTNKHLNEILEVLHSQKTNRKKEFGENAFLEVVRVPQKNMGSKPKRYIRLTTEK